MSNMTPLQPGPVLEIPTERTLLDRIRAGEVLVGLIPCPADRLPVAGETVRFLEAVFEFDFPKLVPLGGWIDVALTSVFNTGDEYRGSPLCTLRWNAPVVGKPPIPPDYEDFVEAMRGGWHPFVRNMLSAGLSKGTLRLALRDVVLRQISGITQDSYAQECFLSLVGTVVDEVIDEECKALG